MNRVAPGRLYHIAERLNVPVTFFYEGAVGPKRVADKINEGLQLARTFGPLRVLRAFEKMDHRSQEHFLALVEILADRRKASRG